MKMLDRLIVREWLYAFSLSFLVLLFLVFMADFIAEYLRAKTISYILLNFARKLPDFLGKLLPSACLLGSLFSLSKLQDRNELTALFSSGWSIARLYLLVAVLSFGIGFVQVLNFGFFAPWGQRLGTQNETQRASLTGDAIWYKGKDYFMAFAGRNPKTNELKDVRIYSIAPNFYLKAFQTATSAKAEAESTLWSLSNARSLRSLDEKTFSEWKEQAEQKIALDEAPGDLEKIESGIIRLNLPDFFAFLQRQKMVGIEVLGHWMSFWNIFAFAWLCPLFALIPLYSAFNPGRRNSSFGKNVGFTLVFSLFFWVIHESVQALGLSGALSAFWSTHLSPAILLVAMLAILRFRSLRAR